MLEKEQKVAVKAVHEAAKVCKKYFGKSFYVKMKGKIDLATQADVEAEKKIHSILSKAFPRDSFLQEEAGKAGEGERVWVVDPIDGTINFAHGIPWFATSIALVKNNEAVLGVCFDPLNERLFTAVKGKGAFLNGKKIEVSKKKKLVECVLSTGFPYERGEIALKTIKSMENFIEDIQGFRRFGAAVLDLCFVAKGSFDGFFEYKLFPWDVAAANLVVEEAGGRVTDFFGRPANIFSESFVASNGLIHDKLLQRLVKP